MFRIVRAFKGRYETEIVFSAVEQKQRNPSAAGTEEAQPSTERTRSAVVKCKIDSSPVGTTQFRNDLFSARIKIAVQFPAIFLPTLNAG